MRKQALTWWNQLSDQEKEKYTNDIRKDQPFLNGIGLTGREIERIYQLLKDKENVKDQ